MSPAFSVKYSLYRMEAPDAVQAKKDVCDIFRTMPEKFISVMPPEDRRPLWKKLVFGFKAR